MTARTSNVGVGVSSNINDVIDSIDDVKDDIRHEMRKRVNRAMGMCAQRARVYVQQDADYTGRLHEAIKTDTAADSNTRELEFSVYTDARIAPHAALVEFGSGKRGSRGDEWKGSESAKPPETYPPGFPYDAPDPQFDEEVPSNLDDFPEFAELVSVIEEWMREKPVEPEDGRTIFESSVLIAKAIVEKGRYQHPFLRPAWYDTELRVKKAATNALRNATR